MGGIDLHTHLAPPVWPDELAPGPAKLADPGALEQWLDEVDLDAALVSPPPPYYRQDLPEVESADWVRRLNDGLDRMLDGRPRLAPATYLPLEHPQVALQEAHRALEREQFAAFTGSAGGGSVPLDDPCLEPLWALLEEHDAAILLHPGQSPDDRLNQHYLANLLGNPYETGVAAAQLLLGDVLGRHSELRVMLVHCGGVLPSVLSRWQRGIDTTRPGLQPLTRPLSEALRGIWVDALNHEPQVVDLALRQFGADRTVLGSDWPFPMGLQDPREPLQHLAGDLLTDIGITNATTLLGARCPWRPETSTP
ncbi:amidohydrolase family protein [Phycicoccus ginsengisoli]